MLGTKTASGKGKLRLNTGKGACRGRRGGSGLSGSSSSGRAQSKKQTSVRRNKIADERCCRVGGCEETNRGEQRGLLGKAGQGKRGR